MKTPVTPPTLRGYFDLCFLQVFVDPLSSNTVIWGETPLNSKIFVSTKEEKKDDSESYKQ